jgi:predicted transcriptional regulator
MPPKKSLRELLAKATVADYMSAKMVTLDSKCTVLDIAKAMSHRSISSVAIAENNRIVGILTERDIVKSVAKGISLTTSTVASCLVFPPLVTIGNASSLQKAAKLMAQNRVRHLFVEDPDNRKIIGIVTATDMVRYLRQVLSSREAERLMLEFFYPSEEEGEKQFWR